MKEKLLFVTLATCVLVTMSACAHTDELTENLPQDSEAEETSASQVTVSYSYSEEVQEEQTEQQPAAVYIKYVKVTADGVNIRSGAGTGYTILGSAEKDTCYACIGETDGWYKIYYLNTTAYISKTYAALCGMQASESSAVESVIEEGAKLLGTPYVYGAVRYHDGSGNVNSNFTDTRFDCSSLTQYIFYKGAGVLLDVTTRTQILQGVTVAKADLQRGDLLFFTNSSRCNNTGIERVGHVALYLGDNLILHTSSDYAKIEAISAQRWNYFLQAQRMV